MCAINCNAVKNNLGREKLDGSTVLCFEHTIGGKGDETKSDSRQWTKCHWAEVSRHQPGLETISALGFGTHSLSFEGQVLASWEVQLTAL